MEYTSIIIYASIGLLSGFMSGMFGIGGGTVRIPLLYLAGLPLLGAFAINLFVIPFSSIVGAISHRRNIDKKVAIYVIIGGVLGSAIGAFCVGLIPTLILAIIFVALAGITVSAMYLDRIAPKFAAKINPSPKVILTVSFLLNLITGMRGGSGGSLFSPFLRAVKLNIHRAIATALFATIFTALAGLMVYWHRGDLIWLPALCVVISSVVGVRVGSMVSLKTKSARLETGLAILVVALAFIILYKALWGEA